MLKQSWQKNKESEHHDMSFGIRVKLLIAFTSAFWAVQRKYVCHLAVERLRTARYGTQIDCADAVRRSWMFIIREGESRLVPISPGHIVCSFRGAKGRIIHGTAV